MRRQRNEEPTLTSTQAQKKGEPASATDFTTATGSPEQHSAQPAPCPPTGALRERCVGAAQPGLLQEEAPPGPKWPAPLEFLAKMHEEPVPVGLKCVANYRI